MLKKGLITLVCLAAMTALAAWAATSYVVVTKVSNSGGVIVARGVTQSTASTVYRSYTTAAAVPMSVARKAGYRISALSRNGATVALGNYTANYSTTFVKSAGTSQSLTATFAAIPLPPPPATYTWQMQTQINSASGTISTVRNGVTVDLTTPNLLVTKNYTDTVGAALPVTATITADAGYKISSVATTGTVTSNDGTVATVTGIPATGLSINYVTANFAPKSLTVTDPSGATSVAVYGSTTAMVVTPTGTNNVVNSITVSGPATATYADKNGNPVALPFAGPVTATLANITGDVSVAATYGSDTRDAMYVNCTVACHANAASTSVQAVFGLWDGSQHRTVGTDCITCHESMPGVALLSIGNKCVTCHSSSTQAANFALSSHNTGDHAKLYYQMDQKACYSCHNSHSTVATYTACNACHRPGSAYGIYSSNMVGKAPHFGGADTAFGTIASFITTDGATCKDCHGHNNTINAGWAEGGHGDTLAVPWKSDAGHTWNAQGPAANGVNFQSSPQQTNCIRCHTARGFAAFVDSNFTKIDQIKLADGTVSKASAPLTCNGCHTSVETGALRGNFGVGYKAFWGYSNATFAKKKIVTSIQLGDNKNSNICIPCHSQRASGQEIKDLFAAPAFKQYSVGSNVYPHAAQPAAVFYGKGGYEFASAQTYTDRARHQRIGNYGTGTGYNNTGVTQGSCVACHMATDKSHSLEITSESFVNTCYKCHPSDFVQADVTAKKAEFDAAVVALGNLLVKKGITLDGVNPLPERKSKDMSLGTKDMAVAEKNIGAWFNWYLFSTSDKGAYAHNPSYARRLIFDSIDWLDDNVMNASSATTIQGMGNNIAGNTLYNASVDVTKAGAFTTDPGCLGCHLGTGGYANGEAIPGVQQAPHFNTTGALVPGQTFTQAQFVTPGSQCNLCHGIGHGTDSPSYKAAKASFPNLSSVQGKGILANYAESAHGDINGMAWTDYDFKTRATCVVCHTTKGFVDAVSSANSNSGKIATAPAWGTTGDTSKQVLGCNTCHSSTAWKTSVRTITGGYVAGMGGFGLAQPAYIAYPDAGESNVCIPCHASRENGATINASTANFANTSFKNPHYLAAAAVFYGKGGFQFYSSSVRYNTYGAAGKVGRNANWSHGKLGMDNYTTAALTTGANVGTNKDNAGKVRGSGNQGQCVACHMGPTDTHTFGAFETAKATWGTNSTNAMGCFGCHSGENMEEVAVGEKAKVDRALDFLSWNLQQYGLFFNNDKNPYFFTTAAFTTNATNWTNNPYSLAGVTGKQTMGAAMNLKLLKAEKGSHVHNRSFMRALIADSVVYLQKGEVGDRTVLVSDPNSIMNFSNYSSAVTPVAGGAPADGIAASIKDLKGYLTSGTAPNIKRR